MNISISDRHKKFIEEIAEKEGFKRFKLNFNQGALKGDNYLGLIVLVKIEETSSSRVLNLVLKCAQKSDELREKSVVKEAYERENFVYGTIFPSFFEIGKEKKIKNLFDDNAKYYGGLNEYNEECLILENMKEIGYKLWDRRKPMDSHHVGAVMAQYGKCHAFSYALKKFNPEKYDEMMSNLGDVFTNKISDEETQKSIDDMKNQALKAISGDVEAAQCLEQCFQSLGSFFKDTLLIRDKYSVVLHGDCWCNNILFKYEEMAHKPSKVCLIDWQLSLAGNPMLDIEYFFYTCSSKSCLDDYKSYLKMYHESMDEILKQFNLNVVEFMPFDVLEEQWRIYAKYGLYMALLINKIMLTEPEEAVGIDEITKENKSIYGIFNVEISEIDEYNKKIKYIVQHMMENRFI